jgi:hypothetical protein
MPVTNIPMVTFLTPHVFQHQKVLPSISVFVLIIKIKVLKLYCYIPVVSFLTSIASNTECRTLNNIERPCFLCLYIRTDIPNQSSRTVLPLFCGNFLTSIVSNTECRTFNNIERPCFLCLYSYWESISTFPLYFHIHVVTFLTPLVISEQILLKCKMWKMST